MKIQPMPADLFEKLTEAGVASMELQFSGGHDEGYLYIYLRDKSGDLLMYGEGDGAEGDLIAEASEWAWSVYDYNGAGEGVDYGDDIVYNLETGEAIHTEWIMERVDRVMATEEFTLS